MSNLEEQVKQLRRIIFNMLNYTNMYVLILNENMNVKFANNSLANDLGFDSYNDILGKCWLDFIKETDKKRITAVHEAISTGKENEWQKYKEFENYIIGVNNKEIKVLWFNSHINTNYDWAFSFGVKKEKDTFELMPTEPELVRSYYQKVVQNDRTMIKSMRDMILMKDAEKNEACLSV